MASITADKYGFALRFQVPGHTRRKVRLTGWGAERAELAKHHVEVLLRARKLQQPVPVLTLDWLYHSGPPNLQASLAACGVLEDRRLLGDAGRAWIMARIKAANVQKRIEKCERVLDSLVDRLGDVELEAITPEQLDAWASELEGAENTVTDFVRLAQQMFGWCVRERLLAASPAADLQASYVTSDKLVEVSAETVGRLMAAVDPELCAFLALARWGGLRLAEIPRVMNEDIDWNKGELMVRESKRAKSGYTRRLIPLFPELRAPLQSLTDNRDLVMPTLAALSQSGVTDRVERAAEQLGIQLWPRLWQNMRATRESELIRENPAGLVEVCKWIGNSPQVALKHYAIAQAGAFRRAAGEAA